jgi:hypothetical protein
MEMFCPLQTNLKTRVDALNGIVSPVAVHVPPEGVEHCRTIVDPSAYAPMLAEIKENPAAIKSIFLTPPSKYKLII